MGTTLSVISLVVSAVSAVAALLAWWAAKQSAEVAQKTLDSSREQFRHNVELTKAVFKRQGVIDLHMAWQNVNDIDPKKPIIPDIVRATNALGLTASLWNHDVVEREILLQSYWDSFEHLFQVLDRWDVLIPELKRTGKGLLSPEVRTAYEQMKTLYLNKTQQTTL